MNLVASDEINFEVSPVFLSRVFVSLSPRGSTATLTML